ncbi:hypothetical protein PVAP13_6KG414075 [Panicum virgatum]|uniref:Uncharacterized protein n=1 Tax=Panicum virgatum TaxID=38727 RepID=A0A8T0RI58_PANVG|nr:hypothetical protein PVAP13_6KG414075 [Panicum virgatum]
MARPWRGGQPWRRADKGEPAAAAQTGREGRGVLGFSMGVDGLYGARESRSTAGSKRTAVIEEKGVGAAGLNGPRASRPGQGASSSSCCWADRAKWALAMDLLLGRAASPRCTSRRAARQLLAGPKA